MHAARSPRITPGGWVPDGPIWGTAEAEYTLEGPTSIVAHGMVAGHRWVLQRFVITPIGEWWEAGHAAGPALELLVESRGAWSANGEVSCWIPEGHAVALTGVQHGDLPDASMWIGVVTDSTDRVVVRLRDGSVERLRPQDTGPGFPRHVLFALPGHEEADVEAVEDGGGVLGSVRTTWRDLPPGHTSVRRVNPPSVRPGSPPPGWPAETRTFRQGQGPRWEEDLYLHVATFPLFALPPASWPGPIGLTAAHDRPGSVLEVGFVYLEAAGERSLTVFSTDPAAVEPAQMARWWIEPPGRHVPGGSAAVAGFCIGAATSIEGAATFEGTGTVAIQGREHPANRWSLPDPSGSSLLRVRLPDAWITILGTGFAPDEVVGLAASLERVELGSPLLAALIQAMRRPPVEPPRAMR